MQRDAQVRACLTTKRLAVLSETAEVHPADETQAAKRAADVVAAQLAQVAGGITGIVTGALDALAMGYAVGELIWSEQGYDLLGVRWHDPRRFQFETDDTGVVVSLLLLDHGIVFPAENFVIFSHQSRYGNPYGEPDLLAAFRAWSTKDQLRRMWLAALDRFAVPIPTATYPKNWTDAQVSNLSATLSNVQYRSSLCVPDDVTIDILLDKGRTEPAIAFHTAIAYEDAQIARAILGQELTTQGSSGGSGSYALGQVHEGVKDDWIISLRHDVAAQVLQPLAKVLTMWHVGETASDMHCPTVTFPNLSAEELKARSDMINQLITGQVIAPSETWLRSYLGLPENKT